MAISFNDIPDTLRVPLAYVEFDNSQAVSGTPTTLHKSLLIGIRGPGATVAPGEPFRVTNAALAEQAFGRGSMLSEMVNAFIKANAFGDLWAIALDDDAETVKASGKLTFTGPCTTAGQIALMIAGKSVRVGVRVGDDAAAIAGKVAAAINNVDALLPVTATAEGDAVALVANWGGITGNDIDVRVNYYTGEMLPDGVGVTITPVAGGVGNPDIGPAIAAFGDTWYNYIVNPFTDTENLDLLRDELVTRWGPLSAIDGICFISYRGTHAKTSTFGTARNDYLFSCMPTSLSPTPPYIWASVNCAVASQSLNNDPARPLQTLTLPGVLAPATRDRWSLSERNLHLYDGISTFKVGAGDIVMIETQITMYRVNKFNSPDPSYLYVETIATLSYLRYSITTRITQKYPRYKLAADGTRYSPGQAIVTPKVIRNELLALYTEHEWAGLVEDFESFKETLLVEIAENNQCRISVRSNDNLVNQFRIYAHALQFKN